MATDLEQLRVQLTADTRRYEANMRAAANETNRTLARIERRFQQTNGSIARSAQQAGRAIRSAFAILATGYAVREVISAGDAWTRFGNQLNAVSVQLGRPVASLDALVEVAMRSRSSLEGTVTLYTRLERAGQALGRTQEEMLAITETVNQAFAVGGASASEQAAAVTQLSQAIASGRLAGDELRSITENAPMIAQAIADAMGVGIGELRDLGAEGRITADIILTSLERASQGIEGQFSTMGLTVSQAMTNLRTAALQAVGGSDQATGATGSLASAIDSLARTIQENRDGIEAFFTMLATGAEAIVNVVSGIADFMSLSSTEAADRMQALANEVAIGQTTNAGAIRARLQTGLPGEQANAAMREVNRIFEERTYLDRPGVLDPLGVQQLTEYLLELARGYREAAAARRELTGTGTGSGTGSGTGGAGGGSPSEDAALSAQRVLDKAKTDAIAAYEDLRDILDAADEALATVREEAGEEKQRLADDMVQAFQQRREEMRENFRQSFSSGVSSALIEGEDGLRRWFANAAERGLEQALNRLADQLFDIFSQGGGGKGGGFFSSIIGGLFGGGKAYGGPVQAGMSYTVGERGPERFVPSTSGVIVPSGPSAGSANANVTVSTSFTIDARGATPDAVASLRNEVRAIVGSLERSIPARVEAVLPGALTRARNDMRI